MAATSGPRAALRLAVSTRPSGVLLDLVHLEAAERGGRRVGPVRGIRNQDAGARLAARLVRRPDGHEAAQLAVGARGRPHRDRRQTGQDPEPAGRLVDHREGPLDGVGRLERVDVGEARQPGQLLVQPGVVLHRARPQRVERGVDAVVEAAEPGVVPHDGRLVEVGQPDLRGAGGRSEPRGGAGRLGQVDAAAARGAEFEEEGLGAVGRAALRAGHRRVSSSAVPSRSMSASCVSSVAATRRWCARSARSG